MSLQDELIQAGAPGTGQDIDDPIWPSEPVAAPATAEQLEHGHEIRTIHGPLDLLQHVEEEAIAFFEGHTEHDLEKRFLKQPRMVLPIATALSDNWRGVTWTVVQSTRIVERRDDRMRVVITNTSAAVMLLSADSLNPGSPGAITIAAGASKVFLTKDEIWATPNVIGTAQTVDTQDEYGIPEWL